MVEIYLPFKTKELLNFMSTIQMRKPMWPNAGDLKKPFYFHLSIYMTRFLEK